MASFRARGGLQPPGRSQRFFSSSRGTPLLEGQGICSPALCLTGVRTLRDCGRRSRGVTGRERAQPVAHGSGSAEASHPSTLEWSDLISIVPFRPIAFLFFNGNVRFRAISPAPIRQKPQPYARQRGHDSPQPRSLGALRPRESSLLDPLKSMDLDTNSLGGSCDLHDLGTWTQPMPMNLDTKPIKANGLPWLLGLKAR